MLDVWFFWCQGVSQDLHNLVIYFWHFLGAPIQPSNCQHWSLSDSLNEMNQLWPFSKMISSGLSGFYKFGAVILLSVHFVNSQNMGLPTLVPISKPIRPVVGCWMCIFLISKGVCLDLHNLVIYFCHFLGAHSQPSNCKHWSLSLFH